MRQIQVTDFFDGAANVCLQDSINLGAELRIVELYKAHIPRAMTINEQKNLVIHESVE